MTKESFINIIKPTLEKQTLYQFNQMKSFVDNSLKEVASKQFETDSDKIKYLIETLHNIRDFTIALTTENSLRIGLVNQFNKLQEEIEMGNDGKDPEKKSEKRLSEILAADPSN